MEILEKVKFEVLSRQKVLAEIYEKYGEVPLFEYVRSWQLGHGAIEPKVLELVQKSLGKVYGQTLATDLAGQLQKIPLVSTIDHHGIFGHPFFLNANLIFSLRPELKYLPVLSTSGVSFNNSSWPGCLVLTNPQTNELVRLSFFHDGHKTKTVFAKKSLSQAEMVKVIEQIKRLDFLSDEKKAKLIGLVERVFLPADVLEQADFSSQACLISQKIWREIFPGAPHLVYFPLENLVSEIIMELVVPDRRHPLFQLLFTQTGWQLAEKYFSGVRGAFSAGRGSFLFWGVDNTGKRIALQREELKIKNQELKIEHQLKPEDICRALTDKQIYPTSLICFLVMLYYNFNCLGGFNQTTWLSVIKDKFEQLLMELGEKEKAEAIREVVTNNFAETGLAFGFQNNQVIKPTAIDLYLSEIDYDVYRELSKKITLAQSIEASLPEIYRIAVGEKERTKELSALAFPDIAGFNGLDQAVRRVLKI